MKYFWVLNFILGVILVFQFEARKVIKEFFIKWRYAQENIRSNATVRRYFLKLFDVYKILFEHFLILSNALCEPFFGKAWENLKTLKNRL